MNFLINIFIIKRYFSSIFNRLAPNSQKNDDTERFMLLMLLSCYKNIYEDQIPDVIIFKYIFMYKIFLLIE